MMGIGVIHNIKNVKRINVTSISSMSLNPLQIPAIFLSLVLRNHFTRVLDISSMIVPLPLFRGLCQYLARNHQSY